MNWIKIKNNTKVNLNDIPTLDIDDLRNEIISLVTIDKMRPIAFFGKDWGRGQVKLFVALADDGQNKPAAASDKEGGFYITSSIFHAGIKSYECLTNIIPSFHNFEREFFEEFKIEPLNHPWLKPLRKMGDGKTNYPFFKMEGDEIHEVAVGPIHAGIIEPGHFRFMCNGENVYHLEIALGYQHKGVENLMVQAPSNQLIESIAGDSVIAYSLAYSNIMETVKGISVSNKAQLIRKMALEMERAAIHIGDLGAISGDIAYLMGASVFGATRTLVINTMLEFSGSRFGRGLITLGGVNFDIEEEKIKRALKTLDKVESDVTRMVKTMLKNSTVMSRLEKTGTISTERAQELGLVGIAARASGVNLDSRFDYPDKWIKELNFKKEKFEGTGDVNSRFQLRYKEIIDSISMVRKIFEKLKEFKNEPVNSGYEVLSKENSKDSFAISVVEGWRGEVVHIAMTDNSGNLTRYKIKDPSFNNWYGLALAVRNNGVSDFPLCNKSFNLSYSGFDL